MNTTGVKDVPKKILLVFLGHPSDYFHSDSMNDFVFLMDVVA